MENGLFSAGLCPKILCPAKKFLHPAQNGPGTQTGAGSKYGAKRPSEKRLLPVSLRGLCPGEFWRNEGKLKIISRPGDHAYFSHKENPVLLNPKKGHIFVRLPNKLINQGIRQRWTPRFYHLHSGLRYRHYTKACASRCLQSPLIP